MESLLHDFPLCYSVFRRTQVESDQKEGAERLLA